MTMYNNVLEELEEDNEILKFDGYSSLDYFYSIFEFYTRISTRISDSPGKQKGEQTRKKRKKIIRLTFVI